MRQVAYPSDLLLNKLFTEYPERVTAHTQYIWANNLFSECNISKLTIGIGTNYYPYYFTDEHGSLHGYEVDLCEMMSRYFEVDIEYKLHSTGVKDSIASLQNNDTDMVVSSVGVNKERIKQVDFTIPYFKNYFGVAVNEKCKNLQYLHELNKPNIKIGVSLGSTAEYPALRYFHRTKIIKCAGSSAAVQRLLEEKVDAVIGDANLIKFAQMKHPNEIRIIKDKIPGMYNWTSIAVAKDNPILTAAISIFLMQYNDSPVRARNYRKWFMEADTK